METDDSQRIEQITDDSITTQPEVKNARVKDPRKVAAGKDLARKNAEARTRKKKKSTEVQPENDGQLLSEFPETIYDGIQKSAILVSSGFILYHGFNFLRSKYYKQGVDSDEEENTTTPRVDETRRNDFHQTEGDVDF